MRRRQRVDGTDRCSEWSHVAPDFPSGVGFRSGSYIPNSNAGDGDLDTQKELGLCTRSRALLRANRERFDAGVDDTGHDLCLLARRLRHIECRESRLAGRLGLVFSKRSAGTFLDHR